MSNAHADEHRDVPACAVVAIGMSAGALPCLRALLSRLPRTCPAAMVIAHHVASPSILPALIQRWTGRGAGFGRAGAQIASGSIHVCPPEHHIVINADATLGISSSEPVAFVRPSIDWFFESVAASYGRRAIAVVLSGANADGARGVEHVARAEGHVVVQHPDTCASPQMPRAALATGVVRAALPPDRLAVYISEQVAEIERSAERGWLRPFERAAPS